MTQSRFGARALLRLFACCWLCSSLCSAQTLQHPEKVQIKPPSAPADALRIWGGLQAGPDGTTQVINADGSIAGAVSPGSITFAMWDDNGCANGNIPQWNGSAWVCATISEGGGLSASDNAVITGSWRFSANTAFGDSPGTAQQLLHAYKSGASAGLRLEQGGSGWWDLTSNGSTLTIGTSGATPLTVSASGLGILKSPSTALDVSGTVTATGLAVNGQVSSHLIPSTPDTYNLGSSTKLWNEAFISQLNAVLYAQQTATLLGGWSIIAKDAGAFAQDVASGATVIDFGKAMTPGHWVLVRAHTAASVIATEYLLVGAYQNSGNLYAVSRDLASIHSPDPGWSAGTPFLVLGSLGDGRIELNAYTTPKISILTQGATYNAQAEPLRIGYLDGMPGIEAGKFGLAVGDLTTEGIAFYDGTLTVRGTLRATAGYFGDSTNDVSIDSTGLSIGSTGSIRTTAMTYGSGTGVWMGYDAAAYKFRVGSATQYMRWDGTSLDVHANAVFGDGAGVTNINGGNIQTNTITATQIDASAITASEIAAGSVTAEKFASGTSTNLIRNSECRVSTDDWALASNNTGLTPTISTNLSSTWRLNDEPSTCYITVPGTPANGTLTQVWLAGQSPLAIVQGLRYEFSMYLGLHRASDAYVRIAWYNEAGGLISTSDSNHCTSANAGGQVLGNYCRATIIASAPALSVKASLSLITIYDAQASPYTFWVRGLFGEAKPNQTEPSPWGPAGMTEIIGGLIKTATINADRIVANSITASQIAANTITAGQIAANAIETSELDADSVTADKINVTSLSAIQANLGTVSLDTTGYLRTGTTSYAAGTGIFLGYDSTAYKMRIGTTSGNRLSWDGSNLTLSSHSVSINDSNGITIDGTTSRRGYKFSTCTNCGLTYDEGDDVLQLRTGTGGYIAFYSNTTLAGSIAPGTWQGVSGQTTDLGASGTAFDDIFALLTDTTTDYDPVVMNNTTGQFFRKTDGYTGTIQANDSNGCGSPYSRTLTFESGILVASACN